VSSSLLKYDLLVELTFLIEYANAQKMLWMHPNGYLLSPQDSSWTMDQYSTHSQPAKVRKTKNKQTTKKT